jgi:hypothetical protein
MSEWLPVPHCRKVCDNYFATIRLVDSLPDAKLIELRILRAFRELG